MKRLLFFALLLPATAFCQSFDSYVATAGRTAFFYRHAGSNISTLSRLAALQPRLRFAMNIQMYANGNSGYRPVGLYIENGQTITPLVRVNNPKVNFGMQPQAVIAITKDNRAVLVPLGEIKTSDYKYAVEIAPMLVINGAVNPKLTRAQSRYIRNGVGILADGRILFAISREPVTFQELARFFVQQGCRSAAFIDGVVSQSWRPGAAPPYDGEFAVMAGSW
ncbi:hypothetical protein EPD60_14770 [Flaviaesturariibacter flavus]|uniref:Phosphodiester glycosidase domain-containing protein n=1 Tax=Flaviaesturariibacter flavus TaxID=2502780 RepID=A0A4R1B3B2_9BACT|nr:phosphodiester glycosidase family protein [Flaviaesturariibacter flavus]TCJ12534.1 hypothetical protein EPD60_14770 [Flaviaesturariibacter flavus]